MCLFGFNKKESQAPLFYEEEPVDERFNALADLVRGLETRADFNRAVGAMESIFVARQKLSGIKTDDSIPVEESYMLHPDEGK